MPDEKNSEKDKQETLDKKILEESEENLENNEEKSKKDSNENKKEDIEFTIPEKKFNIANTRNSIVLDKIAEIPETRNLEETLDQLTTPERTHNDNNLYSSNQNNEYQNKNYEERQYEDYANQDNSPEIQRFDTTQIGKQRQSELRPANLMTQDYLESKNNSMKTETLTPQSLDPVQIGRRRQSELRDVKINRKKDYYLA